MKKIIALILIISCLLSTVALLSSCQPEVGNNGGNIGDNGGNGGSSGENTDGDNDGENGGNPGSGEGDNPGSGEGDNPGSGEGDNPGSGEGDNPGSGEGDNPGSGEGDNPGSGEGDNPGSGEGDNPGSGEGDNPGSGDDNNPDCNVGDHLDNDNNEFCDLCGKTVIVVIDFYVLNDLHGKFCDTDNQPGVDELATYLNNKNITDDYTVFLSSGDIWQGTAESNLTGGKILTEWMNGLGFVSMTIGNHEYDWGEQAIKDNLAVAEFPFLAINVYDSDTNKRVDYATPSIMIQRGDLTIGIIGAIGDCYSSISSDKVEDVYFKVGDELTELVKAESQRLRSAGADLIVYSLHDGYGQSKYGEGSISNSALAAYYDIELSDGYVDLVFEAHSHQSYILRDSEDVYHLQGGGENSGISHVEIRVNSVNGQNSVTEAEIVSSSSYSGLEDDPATEALEDKYKDIIEYAYTPLGVVSRTMSDSEVEDIVAGLYLEAGIERWGNDYDIVLGGGYLKTRSPYDLSAGKIKYADLLSLLPFDNGLVLCSVTGYNLSRRFINTSNSDYHCAYGDYGSSVVGNIQNSKIYYVVVDTYTAFYSPNGLTIVDYYDEGVYARDLFADAIKEGRYEVKHDDYTFTSIKDANIIGSGLGNNQATAEYHYIKGTVKSAPNSTYGNLYLVDEDGNEIYVYGLYDTEGKRYDKMANKPQAGDTIIVYSTIYKYVYGSTVTVELKNATLLEIE